jgi:hypothetical protein
MSAASLCSWNQACAIVRDRFYDFRKIFAKKTLQKIGVLGSNYCEFIQNIDHYIGFEKTPIFSTRTAIKTSTPVSLFQKFDSKWALYLYGLLDVPLPRGLFCLSVQEVSTVEHPPSKNLGKKS